MKRSLLLLISQAFACIGFSQTATIQVDASAGQKPISPAIYGKNNCLSDGFSSPLNTAQWQFLKDAGVKMVRENGGNNSTKYNWRLKLSSHPDWYNNVYAHDWDFAAKSLQENLPGMYGMWGFQLLGKVASNKDHNFNDWAYNQSKWWSGVNQNLAGGGVMNTSGGSKATTDGNPDLYLKNWPADSTVGILGKWFGENGLGLNKNQLFYWNMDNEPEIWNGTHDDVMPTQLSAEEFMQKYFAVAKKARAEFPEIKLVGPVVANEWQWYNWNGNSITVDGTNYVWLEYFIKRIAEEQKATNTRLLDVLDIHFYPGTKVASQIVQLHRVFFDKNYSFPEANGVKRIGGWDNSLTKEFILERCREWLKKYIGDDHGITLGVTEIGIEGDDPNVTAVWYASTLGTFADEGVEIFTPWTWKTGMWETLHLFSRYGRTTRVQSASSLEEFVSAYSSVNASRDSMTVILVNRSTTQTENTTVNISNFTIPDGNYKTLKLSGLPASETFQSHSANALKAGSIHLSNNSLTLSLAPMSITAVILPETSTLSVKKTENNPCRMDVWLNNNIVTVSYQLENSSAVQLELFDLQGKKLETLENESKKTAGKYTWQFNTNQLIKGVYIIRLTAGNTHLQNKFTVLQ